MPVTKKTETVTVRLTPGIRQALKEAAERDHRSMANMIEVLVREHCERVGIRIAEAEPSANATGDSAKTKVRDGK